MTPALPPLREVIARHGLKADKALGQNFLLDGQLLDRIAAIPGRAIVDIGCGDFQVSKRILARVSPCLVYKDSAIAEVSGVTNAVAIDGDFVGDLLLIGPGAGAGATARPMRPRSPSGRPSSYLR